MNQTRTGSRRHEQATLTLLRSRERLALCWLALGSAGVAVLTVVGLMAAGLGPAPREPQAAAPSADGDRPQVIGSTSTPATEAVDGLLAAMASSWEAVGPVVAAANDPLTEGCTAPSTPPVVSASRRYEVGGRVVGLRVAVVGAGMGGVAVRDAVSAVGACGGRVLPSSTFALDAAVAWIPSGGGRPRLSAVLWRRGDVVASLTAAGAGGYPLVAGARAVDAALLRVLDGRCADVASSLADAVRSPYRRDGVFTGLVEQVPVAIEPLADPAAGAPLPVPAPTLSFPVRPSDPVLPTALPSPVAVPEPPVDPGPQPTVTSVASRGPDAVGPGCGWAFVGLVPPAFDAAVEAQRVEDAVAAARADLAAAQGAWVQVRSAYREQAVLYEQQLADFLLYAELVRAVAASWDTVTAARAVYAADLAAYEAALVELDLWTSERDAALAAYVAALDVCLGTGTELAPSATPSAADVSPGPSASAASCPPPVPGILTQSPPTVPPSPAPPQGVPTPR